MEQSLPQFAQPVSSVPRVPNVQVTAPWELITTKQSEKILAIANLAQRTITAQSGVNQLSTRQTTPVILGLCVTGALLDPSPLIKQQVTSAQLVPTVTQLVFIIALKANSAFSKAHMRAKRVKIAKKAFTASVEILVQYLALLVTSALKVLATLNRTV